MTAALLPFCMVCLSTQPVAATSSVEKMTDGLATWRGTLECGHKFAVITRVPTYEDVDD